MTIEQVVGCELSVSRLWGVSEQVVGCELALSMLWGLS